MDFDKIVAKYPGDRYQAHLGLLWLLFSGKPFYYFKCKIISYTILDIL